MLDAALKSQLKSYLERVTQPFEIIASLDQREASSELLGLLQDIAAMSDKIILKTDGQAERRPSFALNRVGSDMKLSFAAIPLGHEFTSLVLAPAVGGRPPAQGGAGSAGADPQPGRRLQLRGVHGPELPQLPGRGAGAQLDGRGRTRASKPSSSTAVCSRTRSMPAKSWPCPAST